MVTLFVLVQLLVGAGPAHACESEYEVRARYYGTRIDKLYSDWQANRAAMAKEIDPTIDALATELERFQSEARNRGMLISEIDRKAAAVTFNQILHDDPSLTQLVCPYLGKDADKVVPSGKTFQSSADYMAPGTFADNGVATIGIGGMRNRQIVRTYLDHVNLQIPMPYCKYDVLFTFAGDILPQTWHEFAIDRDLEGRFTGLRTCAFTRDARDAIPACTRLTLEELIGTLPTKAQLVDQNLFPNNRPPSLDEYVAKYTRDCDSIRFHFKRPDAPAKDEKSSEDSDGSTMKKLLQKYAEASLASGAPAKGKRSEKAY